VQRLPGQYVLPGALVDSVMDGHNLGHVLLRRLPALRAARDKPNDSSEPLGLVGLSKRSSAAVESSAPDCRS
jgi:hypothetical protein